jgi:hypothetical protein
VAKYNVDNEVQTRTTTTEEGVEKNERNDAFQEEDISGTSPRNK